MKVVFQQLLIYYKQIYFLANLSRKLKGGIRQINVTKSCTDFRNCNWNMGKIYSYIFILIIYDLTLLFEMFWNNILMSPPSCESHRHAWMRLSLRFPRERTSRCPFVPGQKSFPVPLSLCPRTKKISCPAVPLSRDKGRSKCPGTNSSVPGRPGTKWIIFFWKKWPDFMF